MINNSVSNAYMSINSLAKQVEKAETDGIPKTERKKVKKDSKRGLLSRSREMFENETKRDTMESDTREQQKLVIAYVLRIRKAFEEVKNARNANTKS